MNFTAPIPGQSLTVEPGNAPWEQPPQMEDPEEAIKYQTKRLTKADVMDDMLFALESGFPVKAMVETLNTVATMNGVYSVDANWKDKAALEGVAPEASPDFTADAASSLMPSIPIVSRRLRTCLGFSLFEVTVPSIDSR